MKNSINGLLPVHVTSVISFLRWLDDDWGISTSGLRLAWTWVIWLRFMIGYAIGYYPYISPYYPSVFWWSATNAENSHNERPWALWTEESSYRV